MKKTSKLCTTADLVKEHQSVVTPKIAGFQDPPVLQTDLLTEVVLTTGPDFLQITEVEIQEEAN